MSKTAHLFTVFLFVSCWSVAVEVQSQDLDLRADWLARYGGNVPLLFSATCGDAPVAEVLKNAAFSSDAQRRSWRDAVSGLCFEVALDVHETLPAVEWVLTVQNAASADSPVLSGIEPLDIVLPVTGGDPVLRYAKGGLCCIEDFRPMTRILNKGTLAHIETDGGRSSSTFLPFFNLELEPGKGIIVAIGWSGQWAANFQRGEDGSLRVRCGMAQTHLKLLPGETIRTPRVALLFYTGDWVRGQNLFRKYLLDAHRPHPGNVPLEPVALNGNWGAVSVADHIANARAIAERNLPVDYYWIDAEWFGNDVWFKSVGDWTPKAEFYPNGFKPLADALHESGGKLLLWFEPERVCEGTAWYTDHAPWLLSVPKEKRHYNWGTSQAEPEWPAWESARNQIRENDRLFNLGDPEARAFLTDFISGDIEAFGLDCFRHDANIAPLEFWRCADAPDRQGMTEIRWIEGLYAFWDALLERHPNLIIDNCASGGRRIDLESLSRATPFWRTDFPAGATVKQCHTYGISFWAPLNGTGNVNAAKSSPYEVRSTWSGSMEFELFGPGFGPGAQDMGVSLEHAKQALDEYAAVKKYFLGDYYPLTEYSQAEDAWMAWQFHRDDLDEGLVQVFRRPKSACDSGVLKLHGLRGDGVYEVLNRDDQSRQSLRGDLLANEGLRVAFDAAPGCAVYVYSRVRP